MTVNSDLMTTKLELAEAAKGLRRPAITMLAMGATLFRFGSSKNPQSGKANSRDERVRRAWWFQGADYETIVERCHAGQLPLGTVARSAGAVQPSYSLMDVLIQAQLLQDILVYVGQGTTQYREVLPNGMFVTLKGWKEINQIYIPGIRGSSFRALQIMREEPIATNTFGY
jgi:hypothetical protein